MVLHMYHSYAGSFILRHRVGRYFALMLWMITVYFLVAAENGTHFSGLSNKPA